MLKIKEGVDLFVLKDYGFEFNHYPNMDVVTFIPDSSRNSYSSLCHLNFYKQDRKLCFGLKNGSHWCNSIEELDIDYLSLTKAYNQMRELAQKLIDDGIVEVENENE